MDYLHRRVQGSLRDKKTVTTKELNLKKPLGVTVTS